MCMGERFESHFVKDLLLKLTIYEYLNALSNNQTVNPWFICHCPLCYIHDKINIFNRFLHRHRPIRSFKDKLHESPVLNVYFPCQKCFVYGRPFCFLFLATILSLVALRATQSKKYSGTCEQRRPSLDCTPTQSDLRFFSPYRIIQYCKMHKRQSQ